jgi:hypothetical protein
VLPVFGPAPKGGQGYAGSAYVAVRRDAASHHWAQASCAESKEDRVANALYADPSKHRVGLSPPLTVAAPAASNAADSALRPQARCVPSRGGMVLAPRVERERTHTARVPLAPAPQQVLPAAPCARPTCSGSAGQPPPRRSSELAPRAPAPRNLARTTARSCTVLCASLQWLTAHALPLVDTEASYVNIYIYPPSPAWSPTRWRRGWPAARTCPAWARTTMDPITTIGSASTTCTRYAPTRRRSCTASSRCCW